MDNSRESVKKALIDLVARKDATVFQNLDIFEQAIRKIGNWPLLPEIGALRAGLQQRLPWELQKVAMPMVAAKSVVLLATGIEKNHIIESSMALWAVTAWATALNIKFEMPPLQSSSPIETPAASLPEQNVAATKSSLPNAVGLTQPSTRAGVIFGLAENGQIKVFKSWASPAPVTETTGLLYTPVKIEERAATKLFSAAPGVQPQKVTRPVTQSKPQPAVSLEKPVFPAQTPPPAISAPVSKIIEPNLKRPEPVKPVQAAPPVSQPRVFNGTAEDLFLQGQSLMPGHGSRVNMAEALEYLGQSAKMGYVPAKRLIGEIYLKGLGVKTDCAMAAAWFKQAAGAGDAQAQFNLGTLYQCGMGVEFNLPMAQEWLSKAANQGHVEAREQLNQMLQA